MLYEESDASIGMFTFTRRVTTQALSMRYAKVEHREPKLILLSSSYGSAASMNPTHGVHANFYQKRVQVTISYAAFVNSLKGAMSCVLVCDAHNCNSTAELKNV